MMDEWLASEPADVAIPRLLDRHGGQIYGLALKLCGSPESAQDLVQETFLRAYKKWKQFEGRSSPSTWLYAIAARVCQRQHRLRSGQPRHLESLSVLPPYGIDGFLELTSDETPQDILERQETRELVQRAIAHLPSRFRLPLVLKDLMELSVTEIAQVLGLKEATVKTRLHRARLLAAQEISGVTRNRREPEDHARSVCLDLLRAKQEAMDRGVDFPVAKEELCVRCRSVFAALDLSQAFCRQLEAGEMPEAVKNALLAEVHPSSRRRRGVLQ